MFLKIEFATIDKQQEGDRYLGRFRVEGWEDKGEADLWISDHLVAAQDGLILELLVGSRNFARHL